MEILHVCLLYGGYTSIILVNDTFKYDALVALVISKLGLTHVEVAETEAHVKQVVEGNIFRNKEILKMSLAFYVIQNKFEYKVLRSDKKDSPAIEDLKQCLEYTGQHSKLVDSFISSLRYRLLTAGASTNDILHQYVSTIKALRTIDPAGVFLEAVGEPIREYLRGRKDTIKCIVTMLTDGAGGNPSGPGSTGDSLLEELNRDEENQENFGLDDDVNTDDKQAWINAQSWEPDPLEADPLKGSRYRRKVDILGMIVGIIGSKDQLINEYRVMLAEKLLNKSDYDIDSEIRTLELLKIHFGESSMQKCEIMLNDLIDSKRTNTNIKASIKQQPQPAADLREHEMSLDNINATIISTNFWPPIQVCRFLNYIGTSQSAVKRENYAR
ncbi:anaphase-promoting complex subunit 2-like, partial [Olea europaea var. sylvestris]|uniref:anaphase-promoting complex subunit 2-like n=1 Tax=Olea europaea var. sylvestris TaxID=158386 RepID=UPI000C1CE43F